MESFLKHNNYMSQIPFGDRLRQLRLKHSLTQQHLAQLIGVTKGSVSQWEIGLVNPRNIKAENMEKLCKILSCSMYYLLDGKKSASEKIEEPVANYETGFDPFLSDCILHVLNNNADLSNKDKALVIRLLYNRCHRTKTISKRIHQEILAMVS